MFLGAGMWLYPGSRGVPGWSGCNAICRGEGFAACWQVNHQSYEGVPANNLQQPHPYSPRRMT